MRKYYPGKQIEDVQNVFEPGKLRFADSIPIISVVHNGRFPFYVLKNSCLGFVLKLDHLNGRSWDEETRTALITYLETVFRLESQEPIIEYTYAFTFNRSPFPTSKLAAQDDSSDRPITAGRLKHATDMIKTLEFQEVSLYLSITAAPSRLLKAVKLSITDRFKAVFDDKIKIANEASLIEEIVVEFSDKVRQVIALVAQAGFGIDCPLTEEKLLTISREAFRPCYHELEAGLHTQAESGRVLGRLAEQNYSGPASYLFQDFKMEQFKDFWISDGCFNMMLSMEEAPDPNRVFTALEVDKLLTLGIRRGVSLIPYFGSYTVAFSSMTREDGDHKFRVKNTIARSFVSEGTGMFEDKAARKEAADIDEMHEDFIEGGTDMVRASVFFTVSIPLSELGKYFDLTLPDQDLIRFISRSIKQQLEEVGGSKWIVETRTFFPAFLHSIPGAITCSESFQIIPRIFLNLDAALHLVPFYATTGPERLGGASWRGGNYFMTDEATAFVFDHFSPHNGTAANFSVCGSTGSGKSVAVQTLIMMLDLVQPYVCIMDFGGGSVGSWTKLCSVSNGVELKFGSPSPPRINPFQLSESDALPNLKKKREIASVLGAEPDDLSFLRELDAVYQYIRGEASPFISLEARQEEVALRCPSLKKFSYTEIAELLRLFPGYAKPGEKGASSLRLMFELLLSNNVTESGVMDDVWGGFSLDDINEAIQELYENFIPQKAGEWPTLSDFVFTLKKMQESREVGLSAYNRFKSGPMANYSTLLRRLTNFCQGGLEPFLDGQTNVDITVRRKVGEIEMDVPTKFLLADMAGISDKRKLALYMIVVNEFMSNTLYNIKDSRGVMVRDEAWLFMGANNRIANSYLEADYRLARKYGFSVITVAQNFSDFKSAVLLNNTQNWIVCGLSSDDEIGLANDKFEFNDEELELFRRGLMGTQIERDVFTKKVMNAYSRFMLSNKSGKYFLKNKISEAERWITTTDANETFVYNFIKDTVMYQKKPLEIIEWLCTGEFRKNPKLIEAIKKSGRKMP